MFVEVVTTITSKIEIGDDGIAGINHEVDVDAGEFGAALGERATLLVVKSAFEAGIRAVEEQQG